MQTQEPDVSPQAPAPSHSRDNDYKVQRIEDDNQSKIPKEKVGRNKRDESAIAGLRHQITKSHPPQSSSVLRLTASQPRLPSTVPDSHEAGMAMASCQSQGDTQPLSQGVQEEFTSRIREQRGTSVPDTTGNQDRSHSYQPGETGHIDFVTDFEQAFTTQFEEQNGPDDDIDPISQVADVRAELYPESKRFQEPKTPAATGNKRSRDGATLSRENTTPRLPVNPFAGQNGRFEGMMNASQAFKATQFTSPPPNQAIAEGFSDRPSPEMSNPPRPSTADPLSSPAKLPRSNMARAVTEPQTTYVSMKESQAERDRLSKLAAPPTQEDSDDGFDSDGSELRKRRKRRRLEMEAKSLFEGVTAQSRPGSSGRGRGDRRAYIQRSSPRRPSGRAPTEAVLISDDPLAEGNDTEDETEHEQERSESDMDSIDELAEDNKENIGVKRVQVPMTTSRANPGRTIRTSSQSSPSRFRVQKSPSPMRSMKVAGELRPILSTASTKATEALPKATQTVAIVDSQSSRSTNSRRSPKPVRQESIVLQSSLDGRTVIPQSQLSPEAGFDQPERRKGDRDPAGTPNVPASSTFQPIPNANSSAFPQKGRFDTATSEPGGEMTVSVLTRNDTTSTDHDPSSPLRPSDDQAMAAKRKSTAMAKELTPCREAALDPMGERPPALDAVMASDEGHRPLLQNDTNGLVSSEEQVTQIRVSSTIPETSSAITRNEQQTASHSSLGRLMFTHGAPRPGSDAEPSHLVQSNASTAFNTAATHLTTSPTKSRYTQLSSKPSTPNSKNTRSRTIAEIAANPSPPDPIGSVDVDVDFLSKDDREFQAIMSGSSPVLPARKRRRGRDGQILQVADSETNMVPPLPGSEPPTSSAAEHVTSSPHRQSVQQTVEKTPATSPVTEDRASSQPRPSIEQPSGVVPDNSAVQKNGGPTPSRDTAPPTAMQTNSRKRGRPRKDIKGDVEPEKHLMNRPEGNTPAANKTLRIEVPRRRTSDPDGLANSENGPIVAPNQVLAHFNGNCPGYYPATCVGITGGEESQYRVRFDDGMIDTINGYGIKRLELRRGDYVKLDQVGARKHVYIVERVHDRQQSLLTPDPEIPRHDVPFASKTLLATSQTDIRGYASVVVSLKQANASDENSSNQSITVPVKDVYLTQTMWTSLKGRSYTYKPLHPSFTSRLHTPSERVSNPSTPSSRSRRLKISNTTHPRSTLQNSASTTTGIFATMAFAITNISDATLRTALRHQIITNGGRLLADGFDELLHIPSLGPASPSKRSPKKNDSSTSSAFDLTETGKQTGFTCLLADKHCRMAKYIQALALGIPCLATRWVKDSVAKQCLLPWQPYLLAAGDSSFLGGAVRSRILPAFPPESTSLKDIIGSRAKPLDGDSVLLIMEKGEEEKMKSHPLITHALGASKVSRATSLEAAARATKDAEISGEPWTWVFSLDKEDKTEKALFGRGSGGRKRKRESGGGGNGGGRHGGGTRVVGNEFVIQSLILGLLVE